MVDDKVNSTVQFGHLSPSGFYLPKGEKDTVNQTVGGKKPGTEWNLEETALSLH